jgi:uncharacterized phiE125 gp8 family phage protein
MTTRILTAPVCEPITLAEAKAHLRIEDDITSEDDYITALIIAARQVCENRLTRALVYQQVELSLECFDAVIELPRAPLRSVESVKYINSNGVLTTLVADTDYQIDSRREPALVFPAYGKSWPGTRAVPNAVTITYWAGYEPGAGSPTDYRENIPAAIKQWLKLRVAHLLEQREPVNVGNIVTEFPRSYIDGLLDPYVVSVIR